MNAKLILGNTYNINKRTVNRLFKEIYKIYKAWGLTGSDYGSACQEAYGQIESWIEKKDWETVIVHQVYTIERMNKISEDVEN